MASRRENLQRIHLDAATMGLDISKDRGSTAETMLWEAKNVCRSNRGVLTKRPSFVQYGTQIVEPTDLAISSSEVVSVVVMDDTNWTFDQPNNGCTDVSLNGAILALSGWRNPVAGVESASATRLVGDTEQLGSGTEETFSFTIRCKGLPTDAPYITLSMAANTNRLFNYRIAHDGLYYLNADEDFELVPESDVLMDGATHRVDLISLDNTVRVKIDGRNSSFAPPHVYNTVVANTSGYFFKATVEASPDIEVDNYVVEISGMIFRDSFSGIYYPNISSIQHVTEAFGDAIKVRVYVAAEKYLWCEYDDSGFWEPVYKKAHRSTRITTFRNSLIVISYEDSGSKSEVVRIYNNGTIEPLVFAPNCKFGVEFADRLFLAGDNANPKRLYFSADRDPTKWVVPDEFTDIPLETLLSAGYFDITSDKSARVLGLNNKFYGTLLVGTDDSLRVIKGTSPADFSESVLSSDVGMSGPEAGVSCMNDFFCLNRNGVSSVVTTDKFGDIASERKSYPINGIFDVQNISDRTINFGGLRKAILHFNQSISLLSMALVGPNDSVPNTVYLCTIPEGLWLGPFSEEVSCMSSVLIGSSLIEHTMIGTASGKVKIMAFSLPDSSEARIATSLLNGRSIDLVLKNMVKSWKHIRICVNTTGNWPITIRWKTPSGKWNEDTTKVLAKKINHFVGSTAITGSTLATDRSDTHIIEIPLDVRGSSLKVELITSAPKLSLVSMDIDFHTSGYEKEN